MRIKSLSINKFINNFEDKLGNYLINKRTLKITLTSLKEDDNLRIIKRSF